MKKLVLMAAFAIALAFGASDAMAQCCDDLADGTPNACPEIGAEPGGTEGCSDFGDGNCIGGDAVEDGAGPTGCTCVTGVCICDASGGECPSAEDCAQAASDACAS